MIPKMFVMGHEHVRKTPRCSEKRVKGMAETGNTQHEIPISSGVLLALELSEWTTSPPVYKVRDKRRTDLLTAHSQQMVELGLETKSLYSLQEVNK